MKTSLRNYYAAIVWILVFGYWLLHTNSVHASESALSASPAILETILDPDLPTQTLITIANNTSFPLPVKASASSFLAVETIPDTAISTYDASRWFTLNPTDFILQPNEVKQIQVTITPPKDAEPGGHYATLYFRPLIPEDAVSHSSTISLARIGVLAMMIMPGDIQESLTQDSLSAPIWQSFGPVEYQVTLTNTGSIHLLPKSTLSLTNFWGREVHAQVVPPNLILPQTSKDLAFTWDSSLLFGPYTATLTTIYGTDQLPLVSNPVTTWIIPWPLILILLLLLTFIYKIFIVNRKRLVLALNVLKGTYEPPQTTQENPRQHPRARTRPRTPRASQSRGRSPRR